jgi:hypothetical protein
MRALTRHNPIACGPRAREAAATTVLTPPWRVNGTILGQRRPKLDHRVRQPSLTNPISSSATIHEMMGSTRRSARRPPGGLLGWLLALPVILCAIALTTLELWTAPPSWLLPARRLTVEALHWAKTHLLNVEGIGAIAGIVGVVVAIVVPIHVWRLQQRHDTTAQHARRARERLVMLKRVRDHWITGVLEQSLADAARLTLGLKRRPDVLDLGIRAHRRPGRPPEPLPEGTSISQVFDQVGGGLLILGAPGAGKTTALLQLADDLLHHAERDPDLPIPVVVNLASWARQRRPLADWLVEEIAVAYSVPRGIAGRWIDQDELAPLLDGLDEVATAHRAACAEAINAYRRDHGLVRLTVCCRTQELQTLGTRLGLEEAVELQPPTNAQVRTYLKYLEETGTPLADVHAALRTDEELRTFLGSPLTLHVVALAYHGRPALALRAPGTPGQRWAQLWEAYVARMFEQRQLDPECGYTTDQARNWLAWLARALRDRDQTEFQLDRLSPEWVPTPIWQRFAKLAIGLVGALVVGLSALLAFGLAFGLTWGLAVGLGLGLVSGLDAWGLYSQKVFKHREMVYPRGHIFPVEQVHWSWSKLASGLYIGVGAGLLGGTVIWLVAGVGAGVAFGLGVLLGSWVVGGRNFSLNDRRSEPNEGIRRSARNAISLGLYGGLAAGLVGATATALLGAGRSGLIVGFGAGMAGGLAGALVIGMMTGLATGISACSQHLAVRGSLVATGAAPWRYVSFLEAMAERLLLRRSGSAYLFVHRLLRDYLADLTFDRMPSTARDAAPSR